MDSNLNKNLYSVNTNKETDIYSSYSRASCAQPSQSTTQIPQRSQHFLPPYAMPVPISNNMPQQLMYNTQNQSMYNIMYGPQTMYRNQNSFSSNTFSQPIDSIPWVTDNCAGEVTGKDNNYLKYDNKIKDSTNCCSPLSDMYKTVNKNFYYNKNGLLDSQWFYENNKYNELPSCSQITSHDSGINPNINECCNKGNNKSVKYCSIQKYTETDPKMYMYSNKYENHNNLYANQHYNNKTKEYPSCSQLNTSTCNLFPNSTCLEIDKKILLDHYETSTDILTSNNQNFYQTNTQTCTTTVLEHFDVQKIDADKTNEDTNGGGESDIVVEDSEDEVSDESEEINNCLVCNLSIINNKFFIINDSTLLTSYSQTVVSEKLLKIFGSTNKHSNHLCGSCMNLINAVDNLEIQLQNMKQDLIKKYNLTLESLKICVNETIISNDDLPSQKYGPNTKFKSKKVCGIHSFKCSVCEKIFSLKKFYKYHMTKHKIKTKFLCEHCGCHFSKQSNLKIHLRKHLLINKLRNNNNINKRFENKKNSDDKQLKNFICQICGKCFKTKTNLTEHENFCSGTFPFNCFDCNKCFASSSKLKQHVRLKHDKNFVEKCEKCNKGFVKKSDYKTHLLTHLSERKFKCKVCEKSYKTLSNLNQHLKIHSDKSPFECSVCQKGFLRKENYESHLNVHNGLKPYLCSICDKKFTSQKHLDAHLRIHKGTNKKKTCPICGKQISHGLDDHVRTHSSSKDFECNCCSLKFLTKGALAKHKKRKHDNNIELDVMI